MKKEYDSETLRSNLSSNSLKNKRVRKTKSKYKKERVAILIATGVFLAASFGKGVHDVIKLVDHGSDLKDAYEDMQEMVIDNKHIASYDAMHSGAPSVYFDFEDIAKEIVAKLEEEGRLTKIDLLWEIYKSDQFIDGYSYEHEGLTNMDVMTKEVFKLVNNETIPKYESFKAVVESLYEEYGYANDKEEFSKFAEKFIIDEHNAKKGL